MTYLRRAAARASFQYPAPPDHPSLRPRLRVCVCVYVQSDLYITWTQTHDGDAPLRDQSFRILRRPHRCARPPDKCTHIYQECGIISERLCRGAKSTEHAWGVAPHTNTHTPTHLIRADFELDLFGVCAHVYTILQCCVCACVCLSRMNLMCAYSTRYHITQTHTSTLGSMLLHSAIYMWGMCARLYGRYKDVHVRVFSLSLSLASTCKHTQFISNCVHASQ